MPMKAQEAMTARRTSRRFFKGTGLALGGGAPGSFDQFPEPGILLERLVFRELEPGAEQEVLESVAIEDAVHYQAEFVAFEINAVIADPESVQGPAGALEFPELVQLGIHDLLRQAAKLAEDLELQLFGHPRQFRRAGRVEDNLEGAHLITSTG